MAKSFIGLDVEMDIAEIIPEISAIRKELHRCPELGGQEFRTSSIIRRELAKIPGIRVLPPFLQTDVVAFIDGAAPGKNVTLRADIDALALTEESGADFVSETSGRMHACGHDAHIAILLMTAKILKEHENELKYCVKLIFQPGEEGDGGALPMIGEGVLQSPEVTKVFGAHVWPDTPVGMIEYLPKTAFAGCDRYEISVKGKGGHGAMPNPQILPCLLWQTAFWGLKRWGKKNLTP